ncbi:glycosyltransferase [Wenzhouxiangella sp. XN24]|uniref:glycosyltransferase n=1 Tax=Wenzhouxiangella sp. XN24 TaxID=2713569 RepID=UPI0013EDF4C4|nr:glycosyltransferase [Wenzhouxiangella sp. XN24]NGX17018.1 glycosyltransferase family 4 protein [Wenzhouxiangella sp. XN24]
MGIIQLIRSKNKPLVIGPTPPPWGGVSVFIDRLKSATGAEVFRTGELGFAKYLMLALKLMFGKHDLIHLNVVTVKYLTICFLFFRGKRYVMDHNSRAFDKRGLRAQVLVTILNKFDGIIVVSGTIRDAYLDQGVKAPITVESSFLAPNESRAAAILAGYPSSLFEFFGSGKVIVVSGYRLTFVGGRDLYGFDTALRVFKAISHRAPLARLLIIIPECPSNTLEYLNGLISRFEIDSELVYIFGRQGEIWPLFKLASVLIRPTISDGFGISVAEAVHLGCPAIASDVCERYPGVIKYRVFDDRDLETKLFQVLEGDS